MKLTLHIPFSSQIQKWRLDEAVAIWGKQRRKPDELIVTDFDTFTNKETFFSFARSRNIALKQSTSDYIVYTDADIRPQSNLLEVVEEYLRARPEVLMCMRYDLPKESNQPGIDYDKDFDKWARRGETHAAPGSLQVFSVDWLKKVGGFDERYIGWGYFDCEILKRAAMDGWQTRWIEDKTAMLHVWHPAYAYRKGSEANNRYLYHENIKLIANEGKEWGKI